LALAIQDLNGQNLLELRFDTPDPIALRHFIVKNPDSTGYGDVKIRVRAWGQGASDASYLSQRTTIQMDYTRQSSGQPEQQFIGVDPIGIMVEDEAELEAILTNGWLQISGDSFRWGSLLLLGALDQNDYGEIFARYIRPTMTLQPTYTFIFTVRNIGDDTLQNVILTREDNDQLSLDGLAWENSINLGTLGPGSVKTVYVKTSVIQSQPLVALIEVLSGSPSAVSAKIPFELSTGRAYCSVQTVRSYLRRIDVDVVSTDEEIRDLIYRSAQEIDRATRRRFDLVTGTERYDGVGQQKLVLDNYPIVSLQEVKIFNPDNSLVTDIKSTDSDFSSKLIVDTVNGFVTLTSAAIPAFLVPMGAMGWFPPQGLIWPVTSRGVPYDYATHFGQGVANVEVTYTYGYQVPPEAIRDACMKMAAIELMKKKGAADTQGVASFSIAGLTETYAARGASGGTGAFGHLIDELQQDVDATLEGFRKRRWLAV
jgi:hypothetical protein